MRARPPRCPKQQQQQSKQNHKASKGGGKGGKGKKGKGGGKSVKSLRGQCQSHTDKGEPICYKYNSGGNCNEDKCHFLHVCGRCFKRGHTILDKQC